MSAQPDFIVRIATLMRDPLAAARELTSSRIVGYVGDIPVELILAADATPVRLRGVLDSTPNADRYLERSFAPEARSIAEQWLTGKLDFLSAVIFPRSDDSAQRLYYYLCELQRVGRVKGPKPILFDSSTLSRQTSLAHTLDSVRRLAQSLGTETARLHAALARTAKRRDLFAEVAAKRLDAKPLRGSEAFELRCAADLDWSESFDVAISDWLAKATTKVYARRLVFVGSAPPNARFHLATERADAVIVHEAIHTEYTHLEQHSDDFQAIAARHHSAATVAQRMLRSPSYSVQLARKMSADGAILWAIEEDEALPWEISRQANALRKAEIPALVLTREQWNAGASVLEQVTAFARTLGSPA